MTDRPAVERVRQVVEPPLANRGYEVVDVVRTGSVLQVTVDRPGGVDLDAVTEASQLVSDLVDAHDLAGDRVTLEVSSPGLERPLRTPEHFRRFVGHEVAVRTRPGTPGERRVTGTLESADDDGVVVAGRAVAYADVERARTVFVWPAPNHPRAGRGGGKGGGAKVGRAS